LKLGAPNSGRTGILLPVIRVWTSHRTEVLLDAFVANLADERKRRGPLVPVRVVVPNRNVETYLRLRLCERCGIAANLETTFLRRFLAGIAEQANPGTRVADATHIEGHLLALLHDQALLARPELSDVRRYLAAADGDPDALDRRRCQLAAQLAPLFDEYAGSRPDMLLAWADAKPADPGEEAARWQRALWLEIFGPAGRLALAPTDAGLAPPQQRALESLWSQAMQSKPAPLAGESVHLFGLSYVAAAYHRMLAELARETDVLVYTVSPCREDSAEIVASSPASSPEDPFGLDVDPQLALRLWARPGRENLRLLARLPGTTIDARFPSDPAAGETLLARLQRQIVLRAHAATAQPDHSLRVLPCPSLRRELEVVAAEIWTLARSDPSLRLCDVAVIVPEASKDLYLTQLSAVFRESCDLPHNIADLPASAGHRAAQAIEHLLAFPFSAFSRKEVLPLLTHPCLMARFPEAAPDMWCALADQLGIVRGADRGDFQASYPGRDLFSWDQGLRRLALGGFADVEMADDAAPLELGGEAYLPGPTIDAGDDARLGFGLLARSLLADARFAWNRDKPPQRPLAEWLAFVRGMVEGYLVLDEDDGAGQALVAELLRRLDGLADIGLGAQPVSYRVAAELARRELAGLPWSRGRYLAGGVTVSSFVPMRAIPFRAIFVLGLGQAAFPRPAGRDELDLRQGSRRAGDVDRREQDLYMFLETLLSARDQVVFSYVARNEITGEELPASSVLLELRSILGQGILDGAGLDHVFGAHARPPLRRHDDRPERREVLPAAEAEHRAQALGQRLRPTPYDPTPVTRSIASLPAALRTPVARVLGLPALPEVRWDEDAGPVLVPLTILRRFLEDPLQASARFRLGLDADEDEGLADVEDEPFDVPNRDRTAVLRESMSAALSAAQAVPAWEAVSASYQRRALADALTGKQPAGVFHAAEDRRQRETLAVWQRALAQVLGSGPMQIAPIRLSPHAETSGESHPSAHGQVAFRASPHLQLAGPGPAEAGRRDVRIVGVTSLCALHPDAKGTSLAFTWRKEMGEQPGKEVLHAFLDYVVLAATGPDCRRNGHRGALFYRAKDETDVHVVGFGPIERQQAIDYLTGLCRELLSPASVSAGLHSYLLPWDAVLAGHKHGTPVREAIEAMQAAAERDGTRSASRFDPVPDAFARYEPPSDPEVDRMVKVRFGLFFDLLREIDT
jgi:exodeoxyribonuclease V gamma subunit